MLEKREYLEDVKCRIYENGNERKWCVNMCNIKKYPAYV